MWKALSPRSKPSLMNERSTLCCSSRSLKKAHMCRCWPRLLPAHWTELPLDTMFHLLPTKGSVSEPNGHKRANHPPERARPDEPMTPPKRAHSPSSGYVVIIQDVA